MAVEDQGIKTIYKSGVLPPRATLTEAYTGDLGVDYMPVRNALKNIIIFN
jgi:hypothetical protein